MGVSWNSGFPSKSMVFLLQLVFFAIKHHHFPNEFGLKTARARDAATEANVQRWRGALAKSMHELKDIDIYIYTGKDRYR